MTGAVTPASLLGRCTFPPPGTTVVCGVSGGADSAALLVLAVEAGLQVTAVHVDHGLRPGSGAEADLVEALAARMGASFRSERAVVAPGSDLEARARAARHEVLGPEAMTGHTADDQAETVLINLLRGAGLHGVGAMTPGHRHPLLALRRSETLACCRHVGIEPLEDPMNRESRFQRTRIRHEVLPLLAEIGRRDPVPQLARSADLARATAAAVDELAAGIDPTQASQLRSVPEPLASAALRRWLRSVEGHPPSSAEIERVLSVARGEVAGCQISGGRTIRRTAGVLRVEPTSRPDSGGESFAAPS